MSVNARRALVAIGIQLVFAATFLLAGLVGHWQGIAQASPNDGGASCLRVPQGYSCQYGNGGIVTLPACHQEDGNEDGMPCLWFDRDTGDVFYVDSADYRPVVKR